MAAIHTLTLGTNIIDHHVMRIFLPAHTPPPPLPSAHACDAHLVASKTNHNLPALLVFLGYLPQVRITRECIAEFVAKGCDAESLGSCVACAAALPKGFLVVQRDVTAVKKNDDGEGVEEAGSKTTTAIKHRLDGLAFRLSPRVLCVTCTAQFLTTLKETRPPTAANRHPHRPLRMAWSDPHTRSLMASYAAWFFGTMAEMSQKRVRPLELLHPSSSSSSSSRDSVEPLGLSISCGVCCRCHKPCKWKCSRCWGRYYCGRVCQRKDWVVHRGECHDRERGSSEEEEAEAQRQSRNFELPTHSAVDEEDNLTDVENADDDDGTMQDDDDDDDQIDDDDDGPPLAPLEG